MCKMIAKTYCPPPFLSFASCTILTGNNYPKYLYLPYLVINVTQLFNTCPHFAIKSADLCDTYSIL